MSTNRAKLLFIARHFPPFAVRSIRSWSIARYLSRLGWDVTVLTPDPLVWRSLENLEEVNETIRAHGIERILSGHSWRCLSPEILKCRNSGLSWLAGGVCRRIARQFDVDDGVGWIGPADRACARLAPEDVDVILATGGPFSTFEIAKRLSDRLRRPYVLDYRDPWTGNPHGSSRRMRAAIVRKEAQLLSGSAAVTIVSPSWAAAMQRSFGIGSKLHVITNGFDAESLTPVESCSFGHFAIVYAGNFYPPKRVITPVMAALQRLKNFGARSVDWYFHYYGAETKHVRDEAQRFGVSDRVLTHGAVTRAEALSAVKGAGVAVVITSVADTAADEDRGIIPGKIFETIGLGTPMLLIAPGGSDIEAIVGGADGVKRFTGSDIDGISRFLSAALNGAIATATAGEKYDWRSLSREFDAVLRSAAARSGIAIEAEPALGCHGVHAS